MINQPFGSKQVPRSQIRQTADRPTLATASQPLVTVEGVTLPVAPGGATSLTSARQGGKWNSRSPSPTAPAGRRLVSTTRPR